MRHALCLACPPPPLGPEPHYGDTGPLSASVGQWTLASRRGPGRSLEPGAAGTGPVQSGGLNELFLEVGSLLSVRTRALQVAMLVGGVLCDTWTDYK